MSSHYDVIVIGLGAMGSSAAAYLAHRGARVLGLEQYTIGHALGSSHGETRLIRKAYFEHPAYVPLLERAYTLWRDLEADTGTRLLVENGLVLYGPAAGGRVLPGVRNSGQLHGIPLIEPAPGYPAYRPPPGYTGILEPGAGYLLVEDAVRAAAAAARARGATLLERTAVLDLQDGMVTTATGVFTADALVLTAGPWAPRFLPDLPLAVHRVTSFWYDRPAAWPDDLPCFGFDLPAGFFYGVPSGRRGVKVSLHAPGEAVPEPAALRRTIDDDDAAPVLDFAAACLPDLAPAPVAASVCMYTMTPDEHPIIDRRGRVTFAAGFSGHGFKLASVVGEVLADLALDGRSEQPVDFLRARRF